MGRFLGLYCYPPKSFTGLKIKPKLQTLFALWPTNGPTRPASQPPARCQPNHRGLHSTPKTTRSASRSLCETGSPSNVCMATFAWLDPFLLIPDRRGLAWAPSSSPAPPPHLSLCLSCLKHTIREQQKQSLFRSRLSRVMLRMHARCSHTLQYLAVTPQTSSRRQVSVGGRPTDCARICRSWGGAHWPSLNMKRRKLLGKRLARGKDAPVPELFVFNSSAPPLS